MSRPQLMLFVAVIALTTVCAHGQAPRRQKPPTEEEVAKAKKLIAEVYRADYDKAVSPDAKLALSARMLHDGRFTNDDPTNRYALLLVARDVAASAGDWQACFEPIAQLSRDFAVEMHVLADEVRAKIEAADRPQKDPKTTIQVLMNLTSTAVTNDRYDIAGRLTASAQRIARDGKDLLATKQLSEFATDLQKHRTQFDALKADFGTLEREPTNPSANLAVGRFRAFEQNRWRDAIPFLALGSDQEIASLAGLELAEPNGVTERLAIADGWWNLADARKTDAKGLRRHAVDAYLRVLPQLTGLARKKVESRLEEGEKWHSRDATYTVSAVNGDFDRRFPPLPSLLNQSEKFHKDETEFAFHISDRDAFIVIDLKKEVAVSRLYIQNRTGAHDRARNMRVYLTSSPGSRGEPIWQATNGMAEWNVQLNQLQVGRYLVIARDPRSTKDAHLHLRKVKVFGPE